jgi:hypothetical protein
VVSKTSLVTITQSEIMELCKRLGHDPAKVARITIEPHVVVVEYEHPITGVDPADRLDIVQHMTIQERGEQPTTGIQDPPAPPLGPASASGPMVDGTDAGL